MLRVVFFLCFFALGLGAIIQSDRPMVKLSQGVVVGEKKFSSLNKTYHSFKGIPYAKPPLNNLRFRPPEKQTKFPRQILDAIHNAPHCIQKNYLFKNPKVEGSEDCLYLNVYSSSIDTRKALPVMVFIHWGGFFAGYSSPDYLGPEYFMNEEVILVTFNYRLGIFGFFSSGNDEVPGNYGLKDQVMALEWVRDHIKFFGGDPKKVTIFGQSAGGASVHYHMLSPRSRGLFHRAISQSGTALALWAKPISKQIQGVIATFQGQFVGCTQTNMTEMTDCLRTKRAHDLLNSGDNFKVFSVDPLTAYGISIEEKTKNNPKPFITQPPIDYIRQKKFAEVPWIVGVVEGEGLIRAEPILRQKQLREKLNQSFNTLMPNVIGLSLSFDAKNGSFWKIIREQYFMHGKLNVDDADRVQELIDLYTDRFFVYSTYQSVLMHNLMGHQPIWFYKFDYRGQSSYGDVFAASEENINFKWGVSHCDELLYMFRTPALFPELNAFDQALSKQIILHLVEFADKGELIYKPIDGRKTPTDSKQINTILINGSYETNSLSVSSIAFDNKRLDFWENLPLNENIEELDQSTPNNTKDPHMRPRTLSSRIQVSNHIISDIYFN